MAGKGVGTQRRNKVDGESKRIREGAEAVGTEGQVWRVVNRERKEWKGINRDIELEEWEEYFRELLGVEGRVMKGEGER